MTSCAYDHEIRRTPERAAKAAEWLDDYMAIFAAAGHGPDGCAALRSRLEALPWVTPMSQAHVKIIGFKLLRDPTVPATAEECDDFVAASMSWFSLTEAERVDYIAGTLAMSPSAVRAIGRADGGHLDPAAVCALYRHWDAEGRLLYVGISAPPDARSLQHEASSRWFAFVDDTEVEWFDTRPEAEAAERLAIADERPLFNQIHNKRNRDAAVEYLLDRLEVVGAS